MPEVRPRGPIMKYLPAMAQRALDHRRDNRLDLSGRASDEVVLAELRRNRHRNDPDLHRAYGFPELVTSSGSIAGPNHSEFMALIREPYEGPSKADPDDVRRVMRPAPGEE